MRVDDVAGKICYVPKPGFHHSNVQRVAADGEVPADWREQVQRGGGGGGEWRRRGRGRGTGGGQGAASVGAIRHKVIVLHVPRIDASRRLEGSVIVSPL